MNNNISEGRLFSLDLLRGLNMLFLVVVVPIMWGVNAVCGLSDGIKYQLTHPWEGFTCWDIIMPMFIFMCGAALLALGWILAFCGVKMTAGVPHLLGTAKFQPLVVALFIVLEIIAVLMIRRRLKGRK